MTPILWTEAERYCTRRELHQFDHGALIRAAAVLGQPLAELPYVDGVETQREARTLFAGWFGQLGVVYFSADEVTTPNHRGLARDLGWEYLVPPVQLWPWVALVVRVSDLLRESVGRAVRMRNLWRPLNYNEAVRGSPRGDHPDACGVDLDFSSHEDQRVAEGVIRSLYPRAELQLSVGLGRTSLHVGVLSLRGHRRWFYGSATPDQRRGLRSATFQTIIPTGTG